MQENPMIVAGANMSKLLQESSRSVFWVELPAGSAWSCVATASAGRFRELSRCQLPSYASYAQSAKCKARGRKLVED